MKKELISDILFGWEKDISSGAGHNHRDSVAKVIIGICQPKWISVDTELPEGGTEVLATQPHGALIIAYISESQKKWYDWEGILRTPITHWQYLPEPPTKTGDVPQIPALGS